MLRSRRKKAKAKEVEAKKWKLLNPFLANGEETPEAVRRAVNPFLQHAKG